MVGPSIEHALPSPVLVTGAAGFIGSHVVERLLGDGAEVVALDNFDPYYSRGQKDLHVAGWRDHSGVSFVEKDIRDADAVLRVCGDFGVRGVVHLAARPGVRASVQTPRETLEINVTGTLNVLEAMRVYEVRRLVLGTSSSVYGDVPTPFREDAPADRPLQPYAASKRAAEMLAYSYAHLHGFEVTSARLFSVYGPRMRPDLAVHKFARLIVLGEEIPIFGDGSAERDYTYVSDIVDGLVSALARPGGFEIVNLGNSDSVSLSRMIELLEGFLGVEARRRYLPANPSDAAHTCADVTKAGQLLGYAPSVPLEEGIGRFVGWFRANEAVLVGASDGSRRLA